MLDFDINVPLYRVEPSAFLDLLLSPFVTQPNSGLAIGSYFVGSIMSIVPTTIDGGI